ncbi:FAD-dependent oxidoreductase [Sphingobium xenophagum]
MSDVKLVRTTWRGRAAVLTISYPPLNLLSAEVRGALQLAIRRVVDRRPERIVITGAGLTFVAGADAREFDGLPLEPHLNDVLRELAQLSIPTIAAVNGTALGAGLELALACRCRIAAPAARLGLPEVTLGLVPGAGGTQRLPRVVGITHALDLVASGKHVTAQHAYEIGLVDDIAMDPVTAAFDMDLTRLAAMQVADSRAAPTLDSEAFLNNAPILVRRSPGQNAPERAIALVAGSADWSIDVGLAHERKAFLELRGSEQAKALRHIFFAERAASSRQGGLMGHDDPIERAIVIGGGNMGAGIAFALARAAVSVTLVEMDTLSAQAAERRFAALVDQGTRRGRLNAMEAKDIECRMNVAIGFDDLPAADIVIEAVFEDFVVKQGIFAALSEKLPRTTILATNTSYLDIDLLAESIVEPSRFIGLHFFSPAHVMKLLEIVRGARTARETLGVGIALARKLGMIPVVAGVCDGFIGNRILTRYRQTADILLIEGAIPSTVDAAMRGFGMAMGPYEAQDMSGLDIAYANRQRQNLSSRDGVRYIPILETLVENHARLGRKSSAGWYDYSGEGRLERSTLVEGCIAATSASAGIVRRTFSEEEIVDRIVIAMIAEACTILQEGIADSARDIDLVLVHGYGFPRWRGGLMHHADLLTPRGVIDRINEFSSIDPLSWQVPPLLMSLMHEGKSFASIGN